MKLDKAKSDITLVYKTDLYGYLLIGDTNIEEMASIEYTIYVK